MQSTTTTTASSSPIMPHPHSPPANFSSNLHWSQEWVWWLLKILKILMPDYIYANKRFFSQVSCQLEIGYNLITSRRYVLRSHCVLHVTVWRCPWCRTVIYLCIGWLQWFINLIIWDRLFFHANNYKYIIEQIHLSFYLVLIFVLFYHMYHTN